MRYGLTVSSAPAAEPVSTSDAKAHLRVEITDDDAYIDGLVVAAREIAEHYTQRALITQTLKLYLDAFPPDVIWLPELAVVDADPTIYLPRSPVQSVTSVEYIDDEGNLQTLAASKYRVDTDSLVPRITPAYSEIWPTTRPISNAVIVTFVAGYGASGSTVPGAINHAIKLMIGDWYDPVRATVGTPGRAIPDAARALLGPYRTASVAGGY